jgi:hypothetical protein
VPDERMSDGEIRRSLERIDRRVDDLAKSTVPLDAWNRENIHLQEQIREGDRDCRDRTDLAMKAVKAVRDERDKHSEFTWARVIGILGIVTALAIALITTIAASKGIK